MQPDPEAQWQASSALSVRQPNDWGEVSPLPRLVPAAPPLQPELIPEPLRPWLTDAAERTQIPLEFIAAPAVVALSSIIGRTLGFHPKREDDWRVIPNLWGAVIGRPGLLKSPAVSEALRPLKRLAAKAHERHIEESDAAEARLQVLKAEQQAQQDCARQAAKKGDQAALATTQEALTKLNTELREAEVYERRYIVNDGTVEKIGALLNENPRGLLLSRDELTGWLRSLEKAGREGDREFYLEAWNGSEGYTYDRIGRGTLHIPALTISIIGSIVPGKFASYISAALGGGSGDDGLLQRFQLLVWPESPKHWENVDRYPDTSARNRAYDTFEALDNLNPSDLGLTAESDEVPCLRFAPDAQELFDAWRCELEARLRSEELEATPAFESHLSKYRSLMPSLALIFHLVDVVDGHASGAVSLSAAQLAGGWCEFLEGHARKIYATELSRDLAAAHALRDRIRAGEIMSAMPVRDIYRRGWSGLDTPDAVNAALHILQQCKSVQVVAGEGGDGSGRTPSLVYLHPKLENAA